MHIANTIGLSLSAYHVRKLSSYLFRIANFVRVEFSFNYSVYITAIIIFNQCNCRYCNQIPFFTHNASVSSEIIFVFFYYLFIYAIVYISLVSRPQICCVFHHPTGNVDGT